MRLRPSAPLLAVALAATALSATPASAATTPPAWDCNPISVSGVRAPGTSFVVTGEVQTVEAVLECQWLGLLTTPPADYTPGYQGGVSFGVIRSDGAHQNCTGGSFVELPSAGPTLLLAGTGVCVWDAPPTWPVSYRPIAYWSTRGPSGVATVASNENMGPGSYRASFVN